MKCRACSNRVINEILDLNTSPPSNNYLNKTEYLNGETFYPLRVYYCKKCYLVQAEKFNNSEDLFSDDYAYFSSYSKSFLSHAKNYSDSIIKKLDLDHSSNVIEVACNDGYLLQYFKKAKIPCIGIEPTLSTAKVARKYGIKVIKDFLTKKLGKDLRDKGITADLIIANNVLAHVPDINDFVSAFKFLLKKNGTITFEFPSLMNLVDNNLWDTVYHEHYSYLSMSAVKIILNRNGLKIYNIEKITTHGGSLRLYVSHKNSDKVVRNSVKDYLNIEIKKGVNKLVYYQNLQINADRKKYEINKFLIEKKLKGKKIIGYGAAAKAATMFNYCGIRSDLITFVVDQNPHKQKKLFPGSRIQIHSEAKIKEFKPDYIIILPWNIKNEIKSKLSYTKKWNAKFVVLFPKLKIFS